MYSLGWFGYCESWGGALFSGWFEYCESWGGALFSGWFGYCESWGGALFYSVARGLRRLHHLHQLHQALVRKRNQDIADTVLSISEEDMLL
jgi:hypothetical protein